MRPVRNGDACKLDVQCNMPSAMYSSRRRSFRKLCLYV